MAEKVVAPIIARLPSSPRAQDWLRQECAGMQACVRQPGMQFLACLGFKQDKSFRQGAFARARDRAEPA
ncbi:hypothetical protein AU476_16005 [Cupriavidus sp. UYMSc13B]|nr:hypothetical protein AU476_16005 [Cupriavidus sp. UYMSc13B]